MQPADSLQAAYVFCIVNFVIVFLEKLTAFKLGGAYDRIQGFRVGIGYIFGNSRALITNRVFPRCPIPMPL